MSARKGPRRFLILLGVAIAAGAGLFVYQSRPSAAPEAPLIGAVRETEIHIAPDITGRLLSVLVSAGQQVHKGDLLAVLSSPELTASVYEAGAAAGQARANRDNVFAGVRKEEIDIASDNVHTAEANLVLARQQYDRTAALASKSFMSKQQLDETTASLHTTEAALEGYADLVDQDMLKGARDHAVALRRLLDASGDVGSIRDAYQKLEAITFQIAEKIYGGDAPSGAGVH